MFNPVQFYEFGKSVYKFKIITDSNLTTGQYQSSVNTHDAIYFIPANADKVLKYVYSTGIFSLIGTSYGTSSNKWIGGSLADNGKIYCSAYASNLILVIDTSDDTTYTISTGITGSNKFSGISLSGNGNVYLTPFGYNKVGKIDTSTDVFSSIGTDYGGGFKWSGSSLSAGGVNVYSTPRGTSATQVLKIDTSTDTTSLIGTDYGTADLKWVSLQMSSNDNNILYGVPRNATQVLKIDTSTDTTSLIGSVDSSTNKYISSVLAQNGNILFLTNNKTQFLLLDTSTEIFSNYGDVYVGSSKFGVGHNHYRDLYLCPNGFSGILKIRDLKTPDVLETDSSVPSLGSIATSNYNKYYNKF